jgi:hypothetical protein
LAFRCARCTGLVGATLQSKLRAVSGFPSHLANFFNGTFPPSLLRRNIIKRDFKRPQNILGGPSVKKLPCRQF